MKEEEEVVEDVLPVVRNVERGSHKFENAREKLEKWAGERMVGA